MQISHAARIVDILQCTLKLYFCEKIQNFYKLDTYALVLGKTKHPCLHL